MRNAVILLLLLFVFNVASNSKFCSLLESECPLVWWETPSSGEFFQCQVECKCKWDPKKMPSSAKEFRISALVDDKTQLLKSEKMEGGSIHEISTILNARGAIELSCDAVDDQGNEIATAVVQFVIVPHEKNAACSDEHPSSWHYKEDIGKIPADVLQIVSPKDEIGGLVSEAECQDNSQTRWCDLKGAVYHQGHFYINGLKSSSDLSHDAFINEWKPEFKHKCCTAFDPDVHITPVYSPFPEKVCDAIIHKPAFFFSIVNAQQYGHVIQDTLFPLFNNVAELNNGIFTKDIVIITNAGAPISSSFFPYHRWLSILSRYPVLSISHLNALGHVCFKKNVRVGLSNTLNMHNPDSPGLHHIPPATLLLRDAINVPTMRMVKKRAVFIDRHGEKRSYDAKQLMDVAASLGFHPEVVFFENMSVEEQAMIVSNASVLVGVLGTGMINAIWLPKGAVGIMICPFGIRFPRTRGGMEFETAIQWSGGNFLQVDIPKLALPVNHSMNVPELAVTDPEAFWQQDWYAAFDLYYSSQMFLDVSKEDFRDKLKVAKSLIIKHEEL